LIKESNLIFIQKAVSSGEVVSLVESASRLMARKVRDVTSFEHTCYVNIGKEMARREVKSIKAMAIHYIKRAEANHVKKGKYKHFTYFEDLAKTGSEGQAIEYDPLDVLANINSRQLELKETITLLAKDDRRREYILNAWAEGYTDDTEISHILADVFTGKSTGHLSFIKLFRKTCRAELTAQAI